MPLNSQFEHGRIALKPLAYKDRALAQPSELMIDYKGEHPSYHIYIVDPMDETRIIDITNYLVKEAFGNVEFVEGVVDGEVGFTTDVMTEAEYESKASTLDVVKMIRVR